MLIPAFSNKITNVTSERRLGRRLVFNEPPPAPTPVAKGPLRKGVDVSVGNGGHLQAFLPLARNLSQV